MHGDEAGVLLDSTLACAVPLWIEKWRRLPASARLARAAVCAQVIAEHGDIILFKGKKRGETARAFNALAEGLALLSFSPGGVKFAGQHWEAEGARAPAAAPA